METVKTPSLQIFSVYLSKQYYQSRYCDISKTPTVCQFKSETPQNPHYVFLNSLVTAISRKSQSCLVMALCLAGPRGWQGRLTGSACRSVWLAGSTGWWCLPVGLAGWVD